MAKDAIDDGTGGVQALSIFLGELKGTIDESPNLSKDVPRLLLEFLHRFEQSNDGPAWLKLQSDEKLCDAWKKFDDGFCGVMIKADDVHDALDAAGGKDAKLEKELERVRAEAEGLKPLIDNLSARLP